MEVAFEKKNDLEAVLKVNISKEDYTPRVEEELKKTQRKINIPGFRPGKAPMGMVKKMYGKGIFVDEVNRMASEKLFGYLQENNIEYLAQPIMGANEDQKIDFEKEEDFIFTFDIGLAPTPELNLTQKDKVTRYVIKVGDADLDKEVDQVQRRFSKEDVVETSEDKDIVYLNCTELNEEGQPLDGGLTDKNISTTPELIKDKKVQKQVLGVKIGDEFTSDIFKMFNGNEKVLATTLGVPAEAINDLNKTFSFKVTDIKRFIPAELNEELFTQVFGDGRATNEEEFRNALREDLEKYYAAEADQMFEHSVDHLVYDNHNFDLPAEFLKKWLLENNEEFTPENIDEKYDAEARQLRYVLLRNKVLADNEVQISNDDIEQMSLSYSAQMLRQYGMPNADQALVQQISEGNKKQEGYLNRMSDMVAQRKFMEIAKTKVKAVDKEVGVEEFYEIIRKHNEEHNH